MISEVELSNTDESRQINSGGEINALVTNIVAALQGKHLAGNDGGICGRKRKNYTPLSRESLDERLKEITEPVISGILDVAAHISMPHEFVQELNLLSEITGLTKQRIISMALEVLIRGTSAMVARNFEDMSSGSEFTGDRVTISPSSGPETLAIVRRVVMAIESEQGRVSKSKEKNYVSLSPEKLREHLEKLARPVVDAIPNDSAHIGMSYELAERLDILSKITGISKQKMINMALKALIRDSAVEALKIGRALVGPPPP